MGRGEREREGCRGEASIRKVKKNRGALGTQKEKIQIEGPRSFVKASAIQFDKVYKAPITVPGTT